MSQAVCAERRAAESLAKKVAGPVDALTDEEIVAELSRQQGGRYIPESFRPRLVQQYRALKTVDEKLAELNRVQSELAEALSNVQGDAFWKGKYDSFDDYASHHLGLTPRTTKELVRVHRKLTSAEVTPEQVVKYGWAKLTVVAGKLTRDNRCDVLYDLGYWDMQSLRRKYQPGRMGLGPAQCRRTEAKEQRQTAIDDWRRAYDQAEAQDALPLAEMRDLPYLHLPVQPTAECSVVSIGIPGLLRNSKRVRSAIQRARSITGFPGNQANLEFMAEYFLAQHPESPAPAA